MLFIAGSGDPVQLKIRSFYMYDILVQALGEPSNTTQENFLYFAGFFILVFVISCLFDVIINMTKL